MIVPILSLQEIKLSQISNLSVFDPFLCKSVKFLLIISRNSGRPDKDTSIRLEICAVAGLSFPKTIGVTETSDPPPDIMLWFLIPLYIYVY